MPYFREFPADEDPHQLLRPDNQYSTPWGEPEEGACDKCHGQLTCSFRCRSCMETGPNPDCPACRGRVEYRERCPTCAGTGQVTATTRDGVSVFPELAGLLRYLVEHDFDFEGSVIVELEGELSDEPDLDADQGALLVNPTRVVTRHAVDEERVRDLRRRVG